MSLYFVSHGETHAMAEQRLPDECDLLTPKGQAAARAAGAALLEMRGGRRLDRIITAPSMSSFLHTARIIGCVAGGTILEDSRLAQRRVPQPYWGEPVNTFPWRDEFALMNLAIEPLADVYRRTIDLVAELDTQDRDTLLVGQAAVAPILASLARPALNPALIDPAQVMTLRP